MNEEPRPCADRPKFLPLIPILLVSSGNLSGQTTLPIGPGTSGSYSPIGSVTYNDNGTTVIQNESQASGTLNKRSDAVILEGLTLDNGLVLDAFNFDGAQVTLRNLDTVQPQGIGVLNSDGSIVAVSDDKTAFVSAAEETLQNSNLNNYIYYDGVSPDPAANTPDYDIHFRFAFEANDYLLVQERYGNTFFTLTALGIDGTPIAGTNKLKFGENGGSPYSVYDWNSGFANDHYQSNQSYAYTVTPASKFFENTGIAETPVFGFQIDNDGEADVKFFGLSDNSFTDNPVNPEIPGSPAFPEPGTILLVLLGSLACLRRNR